MKRIVLLVLCCMVLSLGVCSAAIYQKADIFTGGITIRSNLECNSEFKNKIDWYSFYKTTALNSLVFGLRSNVSTYKEFGLSGKTAQINIDGSCIFELPVLTRQHDYVAGAHLYMLDYQIPQEVIDKLQSGNRVALRFTQNNGNQFVYVLPEEALAEWKQVINTEK